MAPCLGLQRPAEFHLVEDLPVVQPHPADELSAGLQLNGTQPVTPFGPLLFHRGQPFQRLLVRVGADELVHPLIGMERNERADVLGAKRPQ